MVALGHNDRDQQITPVSVAAMVAGGANEFDRDAGIDSLHDRMVEPVQVVGQHADHRLLIGAHGRGLFFGAFLDSGLGCHGISPLGVRGF
ncbi:hypothetical protein VF09_37225 [Nostoc linckia z9]|nr:hypothetical protein VF09_37225 [Nostoc linckia z9]